VDISDVANPDQIGGLLLHVTIHAVALEGSYAYLAAGSRGLLLVDVADPNEPKVLQRFDTPGKARDVLVREGMVFLADGREGLRVINVSNPERPLEAAWIPTRQEVRSLAIEGDRLAVAEDRAGVRLFDVRHPSAPREIASLRVEPSALDVALHQDLVLVAAGSRGLLVYRLTESGRTVLLGELPPLRTARRVAAHGGALALVSDETAGLRIVDLSEPTGPRELSRVRVHRVATTGQVATRGDLAFVAAGVAGLGVVDLSNPAAPEVLLPRARAFNMSFPQGEESP
jgi:hypothetical protein